MSENTVNKALKENDQVTVEEKKSSRYFGLDKKDTAFAWILALASIAFAVLGLCGGFRIGYTVSSVLFLIAITVYLWNKDTKIKFFPLLCGILALLSPAIFFITSNGSVRFWGFVATTLLSAVWFGSLVDNNIYGNDLELPRSILKQIFGGMFGKLPKSIASLFAVKGKRKKGFGKVLLGVVMAIPVLFVVVPLLIASDAAFAGFTLKFFENISTTVFKVCLGLIITPFMISYCFALKKTEKHPYKPSNFRGIDNAIVVSFLSVLSVCYLAYLFSQLAYFFSAFSGFLPEGYDFNVSTYARRGFFEMSVIAAINFVIIFAALLLSEKKNGKICITSRLICLFISIFTLIIISTALSKMVLYIREMGMTRLRVTTSAFIVFLAIVFLSLILRLFIAKVKVLRVALATAGCVLIVLGTVNVNYVVAAYNYEAYKIGVLEEIDVKTIYELGDEGVPYLLELLHDDDTEVVISARNYLENLVRVRYYDTDYEYDKYLIKGKRYSALENYSISRAKAYAALDEFIADNSDLYYFEEN